MEQHKQPLTLEDIDEIMNEMHTSSSCNIRYEDGIISGNSDKEFSLEIKRKYEHLGEIKYDEILRKVDEGDDEFYIKIKLYPQFIPVPVSEQLEDKIKDLQNQIESIKRNHEAACILAMEWGYKQCEKGHNIDLAFINYNKLMNTEQG